jgi:hypothetical protein
MKEYDEVRGLRYNSDKLRYDLIPPLANREYMPKYGHRHLVNIQKETGKKECHGQR